MITGDEDGGEKWKLYQVPEETRRMIPIRDEDGEDEGEKERRRQEPWDAVLP